MTVASNHPAVGCLLLTTALAWPLSRYSSSGFFDRCKFCVWSILSVGVLAWGIQHRGKTLLVDSDQSVIGNAIISVIAGGFLVLLWLGKIIDLIRHLFVGVTEPLEAEGDPAQGARQMNQAIQLYRAGHHSKALRLCRRIIASHSCYATNAATVIHWMENPDKLDLLKRPYTRITLKGKLAKFNVEVTV